MSMFASHEWGEVGGRFGQTDEFTVSVIYGLDPMLASARSRIGIASDRNIVRISLDYILY